MYKGKTCVYTHFMGYVKYSNRMCYTVMCYTVMCYTVIACILGLAEGTWTLLILSSDLEPDIIQHNSSLDFGFKPGKLKVKVKQTETAFEFGTPNIGTMTETQHQDQCYREQSVQIEAKVLWYKEIMRKDTSLNDRYQLYIETMINIRHYTLHAGVYIVSVTFELFSLLAHVVCDIWDVLRSCRTFFSDVTCMGLSVVGRYIASCFRTLVFQLHTQPIDFSTATKQPTGDNAAQQVNTPYLSVSNVTSIFAVLDYVKYGASFFEYLSLIQYEILIDLSGNCWIEVTWFKQNSLNTFLSTLTVEMGGAVPFLRRALPRPVAPRLPPGVPPLALLPSRAPVTVPWSNSGSGFQVSPIMPTLESYTSYTQYTHPASPSGDWSGEYVSVPPAGWVVPAAGAIVLLFFCYCLTLLVLALLQLVERSSSSVVFNTYNYTFNYSTAYRNQTIQYKNHVKTDHAETVDTFRSNLCFDLHPRASVPDRQRLNPSRDEVLRESKSAAFGLHSWPTLRDFEVMVATQDVDTTLKSTPAPDVNVHSNTTTDDNDSIPSTSITDNEGYLSIPCRLFPNLTSSRESTPDKKVAKRIRSVEWEDGKSLDSGDDGDVSSSSVTNSQTKQEKRDQYKWIHEDGEYDLDRGKTCKLGFITKYLEPYGALQWMSEISAAIKQSFDMRNSERFKIECKHGGETRTSDKSNATKQAKKGKKPKVSELSLNLDDEIEMSDLIKSYQSKVSSVLSEVFHTEIVFDKTVVHRIPGTSGNIPYENAGVTEYQSDGFSPMVAVVALGLKTPRPLFMRTIGNKVTWKVSLGSGSMCFLRGKTELRYQRSLPKDFGTDEEQLYMILIQRTPKRDHILNELLKIPVDPACDETGKTESDFKMTETEEPVTPKLQKPEQGVEKPHDAAYHSVTETTHMASPPTVKCRLSTAAAPDNIQFKDAMDFEIGDGLLLAETITAAVENMSDDVITAELVRNNTSTIGTVEERRRRLQQKICMSLGELSFTAFNSSVNFMKVDSPGDSNLSVLHDDLESMTKSQTLIENTLKHVVDSIVNINGDIKDLKAETKATKLNNSDKLENLSNGKEIGNKFKQMTSELQGSRGQIEDLHKKICNLQNELKSISKGISDFKENAVQTMKEAVRDIEAYHTSVFSDESRAHIKEIYEYVTWSKPEHQDAAIQFDGNPEEELYSSSNSDSKAEKPAPLLVSYPSSEVSSPSPSVTPGQSDHCPHEPNTISPHHPSRRHNQGQSSQFNWPTKLKIRPSLKKTVLSNKVIDLWLITDSIMRHIDEFDTMFRKYRVNFHRVDKTDTSQLSDPKLLMKISSHKPHLIYLHLGVNDVHSGFLITKTLDNIGSFMGYLEQQSPFTKLIISAPLLNGKEYHRGQLEAIRKSLIQHVNKLERNKSIIDRRLYIQPNNQFFVFDRQDKLQQNAVYFQDGDRAHLSTRGKRAIHCCMRDSLHQILRECELQPQD